MLSCGFRILLFRNGCRNSFHVKHAPAPFRTQRMLRKFLRSHSKFSSTGVLQGFSIGNRFRQPTRKATGGSHSVNDASGPAWQEPAAVHAAGSRGKSVPEYMTRQQSQAEFAWTLGPSRDSPGKHNRLPDTAMRQADAFARNVVASHFRVEVCVDGLGGAFVHGFGGG